MVLNKQKLYLSLLMILVLAGSAWVGSAWAGERVADERSTTEIEWDLRETQSELAELQDLQDDLDLSGRQSANTARSSAIADLGVFMRQAVKRLEADLGQSMTLKQQGEMVTSGTTEVAEVGSPVPTNRRNGGRSLYDVSDGDRLHVLLNMQTLQVSAGHISVPASDGQGSAFAQYTETVATFGEQLSALAAAMTAELVDREPPEESKESVESPSQK